MLLQNRKLKLERVFLRKKIVAFTCSKDEITLFDAQNHSRLQRPSIYLEQCVEVSSLRTSTEGRRPTELLTPPGASSE